MNKKLIVKCCQESCKNMVSTNIRPKTEWGRDWEKLSNKLASTTASVQFSSVMQSCPTLFDPINCSIPGLPVHHQLRRSPKLMSIELVMPPIHLILCCPLFLLPPSGSFPMSQLFSWGGQSIGVSALASVLPMNTQGWSPSGWTGWISLQSKGPSRVFSNTTVQNHQFFGAQPSSQSNSHIHSWPLEKP